MGGLLAGQQADRAFELGHGLLGPPEGQKAAAREQSCGAERRIEPGGRAKLRERLDVVIPLLMDDPEVVMDECPVTAAGQHVAKCRLRTIQLPGLEGLDSFREARGEGGRERLRPEAGRGQQQDERQGETGRAVERRYPWNAKTKGAAPRIRQSATPIYLTRDALSELEPDPELDLAWCSHVAVIPLPEVPGC